MRTVDSISSRLVGVHHLRRSATVSASARAAEGEGAAGGALLEVRVEDLEAHVGEAQLPAELVAERFHAAGVELERAALGGQRAGVDLHGQRPPGAPAARRLHGDSDRLHRRGRGLRRCADQQPKGRVSGEHGCVERAAGGAPGMGSGATLV